MAETGRGRRGRVSQARRSQRLTLSGPRTSLIVGEPTKGHTSIEPAVTEPASGRLRDLGRSEAWPLRLSPPPALRQGGVADVDDGNGRFIVMAGFDINPLNSDDLASA